MTTMELTNVSKSRSCKMTNFLVVFINDWHSPIHYQAKCENEEQIKEYLDAIRSENKWIDYIQYN